MKRPLVALLLLVGIALTIAIFLPSTQPVLAGGAATASSNAAADKDDAQSAADYCVKKGGEVDDREPYFNTNDDPQNWLRLAGEKQFCKFTSQKDGSRIYVLLSTLYTDRPSLAALAYYAEVPLGSGCNGNPASCYCSQLGGSDLFGGINLNGGGWVKKSDPVDTVLESCIFPDMSTIDSWGLTYHSVGIVRGKNLANVMRYKNPYGTK